MRTWLKRLDRLDGLVNQHLERRATRSALVDEIAAARERVLQDATPEQHEERAAFAAWQAAEGLGPLPTDLPTALSEARRRRESWYATRRVPAL